MLTQLSLTLAVYSCVAASVLHPLKTKIIGGGATKIEDVPYLVQLELYNGLFDIWAFACGATIIGEDIVLTAGQCVDEAYVQEIRVVSGNSELGRGTYHTVERFKINPGYQDLGGYHDNDIAIMKITPPFEFSNTTQPIEIIQEEPYAGQLASISGWGTISLGSDMMVNILMKVNVPIVDRAVCAAENAIMGYEVTNHMICAGITEGGKGPCQGDAGGPMVVDGKLAGLVSWGIGCAKPEYPAVLTNTVVYNNWIEQLLADWSNSTVV